MAQSFADPIPPMYPAYRLTPASPTTQDSVSFWLVKGMNGNSCVPRYIASYKIEQVAVECLVPPCPQRNVIKISYTSVMPPLQKSTLLCLDVMTEYGPSFNFGKLTLGDYTIIDSTDGNRTLMTFSVTQTRQLHDSVTYTPPKPTSRDSIFFSLLTINQDCCTQIYNLNFQVFDTIIDLYYEYYNNPAAGACMCPVAGKKIGFKTGPMNAGYYAVYEVASPYCAPGSICPMARIAPQRVGQITVVPASVTVPFVANTQGTEPFSWTAHNGSITLHYSRAIASDVFAELCTARGCMVKKIHMQKTGADQYEAIWETGGRDNASFVPGTYFAKINADGKTVSMEKISVLK